MMNIIRPPDYIWPNPLPPDVQATKRDLTYAAVGEGQDAIYVGKSTVGRKRLDDHVNKVWYWDVVAWWVWDHESRAAAAIHESQLIAALDPRWNADMSKPMQVCGTCHTPYYPPRRAPDPGHCRKHMRVPSQRRELVAR